MSPLPVCPRCLIPHDPKKPPTMACAWDQFATVWQDLAMEVLYVIGQGAYKLAARVGNQRAATRSYREGWLDRRS